MKILVLGGDGFIGSHFVDTAVNLDYEVSVFDHFHSNLSRNLSHQRGKINFIPGEFANQEILSKALENQDIIYHFICITNPAESWNDPFIEIEENLRTSIQLFNIAAQKGVKKIVFASSGGTVYGQQKDPVNEDTIPNPISPYGINKLATEYFLNYFRAHSGLAVDIYRIGNAYGPRQPYNRPQGVISVWMKQILNGDEINIYGDEISQRDYVYVKDISFLMSHSLKDLNSSGIYNLGTGKGINIIELFTIFQKIIDMPIRHNIQKKRPFDIYSIVLDSSKLINNFPNFKFKKMEDALRETWEYFKKI